MKAGPPMIRALARIAHFGAVSGDEETRTPDFLLAKEALYQLSYVPAVPPALRGRRGPKGRGTSPGTPEVRWIEPYIPMRCQPRS